jgi:hypothetical protein
MRLYWRLPSLYRLEFGCYLDLQEPKAKGIGNPQLFENALDYANQGKILSSAKWLYLKK